MYLNTRTYHPRAGEGIPTETNAIALLILTPLVFYRIEIHVRVMRVMAAQKLGEMSRSGVVVELEMGVWVKASRGSRFGS